MANVRFVPIADIRPTAIACCDGVAFGVRNHSPGALNSAASARLKGFAQFADGILGVCLPVFCLKIGSRYSNRPESCVDVVDATTMDFSCV